LPIDPARPHWLAREMNLASQYFVAVQSGIAPLSFLHRASSCFAKFLLASTGSEERQPFSFWHQNWVIRGTLKSGGEGLFQ
ncbi:MAG: hypothetical protein KBF37_11100, partial [Saprospiraceae bacterium]|nr:hypothetical protein [Saprospiraceae bacterium]MBP9210853.1 hypothetical protein [Saprospiraceae bacterium]